MVLTCSIISFWAVGTVYSWGIIQAALFKQGLSAPSTLSWIGSLTFASISFLGVINAQFIRRFGMCPSTISGITVLAVAEILSSFLTRHISEKLGLANGIVSAGGGLGGTVISLIMNALIQHVGLAWAFRILGLMTLATGLPAAYFIKEQDRTQTQSDKFVEWYSPFIRLFVSEDTAY